ncbi:DNA-binding transcriptional regulator, MerR family [Micromonospora chaiyaphumensis]|uniref:DNA-binding transcriptional regulator, MerR family n=2 Tax=Micromonospora chaiyaphumensis TaxID=307119 RepID=A0A1C4WC83_9ACTN|nr:DNA-binding transcriptional regulator, MerR family [Micromonospora chaiyaphumensis]
MTIGEIAGRFGLATHVLRHWESVGLLTPARVVAGRRRFRSADLYRVATILHAKEAGLTLEQIRELMASAVPARRREILLRHRTDLLARIAALQDSLRFIEGGLECEHEDFSVCPHYQAMVQARIAPQATPHVPA